MMKKTASVFKSDISRHIWNAKYRYRRKGSVVDRTPEDSLRRVARSLASVEEDPGRWEQLFYDALADFKFIPGGRVLAGAGTRHKVTLFNCFVMGRIEDSIPSIFENLKEGALTMQQGGGVGYDFSTLRPKGTLARSSNNISSGPVSFMKIWDSMCATMISTGARRGAMMATLRCDHPDIMDFIQAKKEAGQLTNFNLSVLVTDAFMEAVQRDEDWRLVFPDKALKLDNDNTAGTILRKWGDSEIPVPCRVLQTVKARKLWKMLLDSAYTSAEPGVLFIDRINELNNLGYCEYITATNPCGEVPLPPYGACDLGSVNLTQFVRQPFSADSGIDLKGIRKITQTAVRMLDNVITLSGFPLQKQKEKASGSRRIGLGITGLADALIMLDLHYGSEEARSAADEIMRVICHEAYRTSTELAEQKGSFPLYVEDDYLKSPFVQRLPNEIRNNIRRSGIRNSHLLSIAPTGSISILANNVSSGLEPVYDYQYRRKILNRDGTRTACEVTDYAYRLWQEHHSESEIPDFFVKAEELPPQEHLEMQATLQKYVDNAISKTINIPGDYPFEQFKNIYRQAYEKKLKGCTTFRPNEVTGAILESIDDGETNIHCCSLEREGD